MSAGQWAVIALLVAITPLILGYTAGWWNGRRCLRLTLDPRMLRPVEHPERRAPEPETWPMLAVAGRFPVDTGRAVWSAMRANQDHAARHVARLGDETEAEIHELAVAAPDLIPARWH